VAKKMCAVCDKKAGLLNFPLANDEKICSNCFVALKEASGVSNLEQVTSIIPSVLAMQVLEGNFEKAQELWDLVGVSPEGVELIKRNQKSEFRNKCNVCGHIYCYTQEDLKRNSSRAGMAVLESVGGLFSNSITASVSRNNAQSQLDGMIDYGKCPKCNSADIHELDDEEWEASKISNSSPQASAPAVSSADEIMKFKQLLDAGVISQEEFDAKKKQLLGL